MLAPALVLLLSCGEADDGSCDVVESGEGRVVVGFWDVDDCSGEPLTTNSFPVQPDAPCYCWPGHSGRNSAEAFSCNDGDGSFTYTQYGSLDCGLGDDSPTEKTVYTTTCQQDTPPTLYARIVDYSACE